MAIEIIDLTGSTPPPMVDDTIPQPAVVLQPVEKKKRKRPRGSREQQQQGGMHGENSDDSGRNRGGKRTRGEGHDDQRRRERRPGRSPHPLFEVDIAPSGVVGGLIPAPFIVNDLETAPPPVAESSSVPTGLLLPAHVILATEESHANHEDNPPLSPVSDASGIDFIDDGRAVGAPRYFDDRATNPRIRGPCKRCGDSDHDFKNCTTMVCFTCGARDEHNPRSCPILRNCYNCQGKGHIARDCPRIGDTSRRQLDRNDCERCGSWRHHGTNCPTIWRIYTYLTDAERDAVLADRESKRQLGFDYGGEGYIARDEWCYNCGRDGHLGDDCKVMGANHDRPNEDSAFGSYNQLTGPFASLSTPAPDARRGPREWEMNDRFDDGHGFSGQTNVGRKGREKAKAKAREAQRALDEADDEPDWFNKNQSTSKGSEKGPSPSGLKEIAGLPPKPAPPTIQLEIQTSSLSLGPWDPSSRPPTSSRPSLKDRIDIEEDRGSHKSRRDDRDTRKTGPNYRNSGDARSRERPRSNEQKRAKHKDKTRESGSRWRGGYDR